MLFTLKIKACEEETDLITGLLSVHYPQGWEETPLTTGETYFQLSSPNSKELKTVKSKLLELLPQLSIEEFEQEEQDWLAEWKKNFQPVCCGKKFVVLPPWKTHEANKLFAKRIPIIIEPKNAFGTGQHETTALCLTILSDLLEPNQLPSKVNFLDLGTGSGILALAACKVGFQGTGLDIDSAAIQNAQENALLNGINNGLKLLQGSIEKVSGQQFDLIFANILAKPLIDQALAITTCLKLNGTLILSGLLGIQAEEVSLAYQNAGLAKPLRKDNGEWTALYWTPQNQ